MPLTVDAIRRTNLYEGDRISCVEKRAARSKKPTARNYYECRLRRRGAVSYLGKFKIVSVPDSKATYADAKSTGYQRPKVVYNIGSDQECRIVKWRDSGLDMLSCFHERI